MMSSTDLPASVIVPAHNASATIGRQLIALATQVNAPRFEVILVANRCTDDTVSVARSFGSRLPHLSVVLADDFPSAAHARNVGARTARGRSLLFCDADDEVGPEWVRALVAALSKADLVGGILVPEPASPPAWMEGLPGVLRGTQPGLTLFDGRVWYPPTCCMGCHREIFDGVGGFDEQFVGANSEDLEFALRVLQNGGRLGFAPEADVRYVVRTDIRSYVRQQAGYRAADSRLLSEAGRLEPPPTLRAMAKRTSRRLAHDVVRRRISDPRHHVAMLWLRLATYRSHRSAFVDQARRTGPDDALDTVLPLDAPLVGGIAIRARSGVANWLATNGAEPLSLRVIELLLPTGGTMVDVGANVGVLTLAAAFRVGGTGRVLALEPDPRSRVLLEENVVRHGVADRVDILSKAAGEIEDRRDFLLAKNYEVSGFLESSHSVRGSCQLLQVDQVRLDTVVTGRVDVLKIDVEGWELDVLKGSTELLARSPDAAILCEINPDSLAAAGIDLQEVLALLRDAGRRALVVLEDDHASPWAGSIRSIDDVVAWLDSGGGSRWYGNVLALPPSLLTQLNGIGGVSESAPRD